MVKIKGELGRIGQRRSGGIHGTFFEEYIPELVGMRGVQTYREMRDNDDVINAIFFAVEMLIRQCEFNVEPASESDGDKEAAEFVESCMFDMESTWQDFLSEVLSFLTYGWSYHEIVYKRRLGGKTSKYDDGLIGWKKLPIRAQETLYEWRYKEGTDDLQGMVQIPPPDYEQVFIPLEKALHFRTRSRKDHPEGHSLLRGVYRSWYMKKRLQEIEGIGIERDLAGYPFIQPPEGEDIWDPDDEDMVRKLHQAEEMIQNVRRDELEGMVLPYGWTFTLLNSGSRRQFEVGSVIDRYDRRMATTFMADFLFLGQEGHGSFALSSDKTRLFALAVGTYLDIICDAFNRQAIKRLIDLNDGHFKGMTDYPKMTHADIEEANIDKFANYIGTMVKSGVILPDKELDKYARKLANIPLDDDPDESEYSAEDKEDEEKRMKILGASDDVPDQTQQNPQEQQQKKPQAGKKAEDAKKKEDAADKKQAEEAKKSLGR